MHPFRKKHPKDKLGISNFIRRPIRRGIKLYYGIGEAIIAAIIEISVDIAVAVGAPALAATISSVLITAVNVLAYGIVMVGITAISTMLTNQGQKNSLPARGMKDNFQNIEFPIRPIFGRVVVGAGRVFIHATGGGNNRLLYTVVIWGMGPCKGIVSDGLGEKIWAGNERLQHYLAYLGQDWIWHTFHKGTWDQTVDADLHAAFPQWTDPMQGICYSVFKCKYNSSLWQGFPIFTAEMEGNEEIYDPRDGSIGYSRNPALIWRYVKTHPEIGGIPGSLIYKQSVIDSANWFDSNGYYFDGGLIDRKEFLSHMEDVLLSCRAEETWSGGFYKLIVQTYSTPVHSVDEEDIDCTDPAGKINALSIDTGGLQEFPKRVKATFADLEQDGEPQAVFWPAAPSANDTDRETKEIVLTLVSSFTQALKIAKYVYLRAKFSKRFSFIGSRKLLNADLSDTIQVSHNTAFPVQSIPEDWANKVVRITGLTADQAARPSLNIIEEDPSIYDDTVDVASHNRYITTLPDPNAMPELTNLGYTTGEDENTPNKIDAYVEFYWDHIDGSYDYDLRWRRSDGNVWVKENIKDPFGTVGIASFSGTGTLKLKTSGEYSALTAKTYIIKIDGAGSPNTFKWSDDNGVTWEATGVAIVAGWISLNNDIKIKFSGLTGGVIDDQWTIECIPCQPVKFRVGKLQCGQTIYWQVRPYDKQNKGEWATSDNPVVTWAPTTPATVAFDDAKSGFAGPNPVLVWTALATEPDHYELRSENANWGAKDAKHIAFPSGKATLYDWKQYVAWCDKQGLTEAQKRTITIYIKAVDKTGAYSGAADSITLSNSAPTMSGYSPSVVPNKAGLHAVIKWADWAGISATDLDQYKIYVSTEATCTINADNLKKTVAAKVHQVEITDLSRGVTYDFRVVPWDIYGEGVASS